MDRCDVYDLLPGNVMLNTEYMSIISNITDKTEVSNLS